MTIPWLETVKPFIRSLLFSVLLSGALAFVLSILLALWLAQSLSSPLRRAAAAAERVAARDYSVSLDIALPDEGRRLAQSFNTMTRAVAAAQRSQRDFVANVSHELKTPLTSMQGFAQAILDGTAGDRSAVSRAAEVIHNEAERLSRLVHKLLDLTRLESGESTMSWTQIDLASLLRTCAEQFAPLAADQDVLIGLELPESAIVTADGDRLIRVFTNLIDNALKHVRSGGRVTVSLDEREDSVSVAVADTGHRIPAEDLPRVFERFYQVDKSRSRQCENGQAGVGLGLAIASEIVRAHGGRIGVESIVGVGTRFTVTLPRRLEESALS